MSSPKYKYFTNGVWPIRAILSGNGDPYSFKGTETPNIDTGNMQLDMRWLGKIDWDTSGDMEEITEEKFNRMVDEFLSQKKTNPNPPPEIGGMQ
jgi:hypothetical protein